MANCPTGTLPVYLEDATNCFEDGRVVALAFIDKSITFTDITDPTEWDTAITAQDIRVHKEVRGSYPRASTVFASGVGNQAQRVVGATHTLNAVIENLKGNSPYWDELLASNNYKLAFVVGADYDKLFYVDRVVSIDFRPEITEELNSEAHWAGVISWSDQKNPEITDVPAGIFT